MVGSDHAGEAPAPTSSVSFAPPDPLSVQPATPFFRGNGPGTQMQEQLEETLPAAHPDLAAGPERALPEVVREPEKKLTTDGPTEFFSAPGTPTVKVDIDINNTSGTPNSELTLSSWRSAGMLVLAVVGLICIASWMIDLAFRVFLNLLERVSLLNFWQYEAADDANESPENDEADDLDTSVWQSFSALISVISLMKEVCLLIAPLTSKLV